MNRVIYKYTPWDNRSLIYEGTFLEGDDVEINVGDEILVFHKCKYCMVQILTTVIWKRVAYYFGYDNKEPQPIYDYGVTSGESYKCIIKHISLYDQIVDACKMSD